MNQRDGDGVEGDETIFTCFFFFKVFFLNR